MGPWDLQQKKAPISNARQQTAVFGLPQEVSPVDVDCIEPWAEQLMNNPLVSIKLNTIIGYFYGGLSGYPSFLHSVYSFFGICFQAFWFQRLIQ